MALILHQKMGGNPLSLDILDADLSAIKGGEVVGLSMVTTAGSDLHTYDNFDGYVNDSGTAKRPVVTSTLASGMRPLFLADDGTTGYGTLFGSVVGGTGGQVVTGGAVLGPHTAIGSGKLTCWGSAGWFAVSLDAVDTTASTGLVPTNNTLVSGDALYATTAGLLTPNSGAQFENVVIGRFIEFTTTGTLVNTPSQLVQALNSPPSASAPTKSFDWALFSWSPPA